MPLRARRIVEVLSVLLGILAVATGLLLTRFDRQTDFQIFYASALAWRHAGVIYPDTRPNLNLPAVIVAYVPLTYLSERNAMAVFTLIGVMCGVAASRRIARVVPRVPWFVLASLVFALEGGWTNLWLGQEGLILMLVATLAWIADRERRDVAAGCWAGIAIYSKPFLAGLVIYWIWQRRWRALAIAIGTIIAIVAAGAVVAGPMSYLAWWRSLANGPAPYTGLNASLLGLWSRFFFGSEFAPPLVREPARVLLTVWALSVIVLLIAIYRRVTATRSVDVGWALILLGSLLVSPLGWIYYLPVVAGPLLASIGRVSSWVLLWMSAYVLLLFRSSVLANLHMSAPAAITVGSIYMWAVLLLFVAACGGGARGAVGEVQMEDRLSAWETE